MQHPISRGFNFREFLDAIKDLSPAEMIIAGCQESEHVQRISSKVKGSVAAREAGSLRYDRKIGQFLYFLRSGAQPLGVSEWDFRCYKPIVERFVRDGLWNAGALKMFDRPDRNT